MLRAVCRLLAAVLLLGAPTSFGQSEQPGEPVASAEASVEQAERLDRFRRIIENVDDSDTTRTAQAEELLMTGWPAATDLVVTLLGTADEPSTKAILCQAIANVGRRHPERLDQRLVDPLAAMLGSPSEVVARRAGEALATFPGKSVIRLLSSLAADPEVALAARLAALDALAPNANRREAVAELVGLLDTQEPELVRRVVAALADVSGADYGTHAEAWKGWWQKRAALSEAQWLDEQLTRRAQQLRRLQQEHAVFKDQAEQRQSRLAARLAQALSGLYRLTPKPEKDALLEGWLLDETAECRRVAVSLVAEQISEGNLPSEALRGALRRRYGDESAEVRRLAVEVIGALNDPTDAEAILARLAAEQDARVRVTILRVLGKLRNPDAIEPLLAELAGQDVPDSCAAAAADALGMLAARGRVDEELMNRLVGPLKSRFARTGDESRVVRVGILGAMAAIGSVEFREQFESNLSADDPELLLRAIQGVATIGNGEQVDRLCNLTTHTDARVRQRAVAALGTLGTEEQLSTIIARLSPSVETVEGPRRTAWQSFKQICSRLSLGEQVAAADRLADHPQLVGEYLKEIHGRFVQTNPPPPELPAVREKLAHLYTSLGRNQEALPYWRQLHALALQAGSDRVHEFGLALLRCSLACGKTDQILGIVQSLAVTGERDRQWATSAVIAYLDRLSGAGRETEAHKLADELRGLSADSFGALRSYLDGRFPEVREPAPSSQPADSP